MLDRSVGSVTVWDYWSFIEGGDAVGRDRCGYASLEIGRFLFREFLKWNWKFKSVTALLLEKPFYDNSL